MKSTEGCPGSPQWIFGVTGLVIKADSVDEQNRNGEKKILREALSSSPFTKL
jgi:hypothetical protein